ncbi:MAG: hypothetical protein GXP48_11965 [Acidobacteria bacterium]|nr:hypothetical protein [Acidobacteriota bacterium]
MTRRHLGLLFLTICVVAGVGWAYPLHAAPNGAHARGTNLLGRVSWAQLEKVEGWKASYDAYRPDPAALARLRKITGHYRIVVVLGSWCSDSRREVPRLVKVLDAAGGGHFSLEMYGVGHTLTVHDPSFPKGVLPGIKAERVPTIVVLDRDGQELGRVVETAEQPLETLLYTFVAPEERRERRWKSQ